MARKKKKKGEKADEKTKEADEPILMKNLGRPGTEPQILPTDPDNLNPFVEQQETENIFSTVQSIMEGDVVVTFNKGNVDNQLLTGLTRVFCKDEKGQLEQIGYLQEIEIRAALDDLMVSFRAKLPKESDVGEESLPNLRRYRKLMEGGGISMNLCTCEVHDGAIGIDNDCPVHGVK